MPVSSSNRTGPAKRVPAARLIARAMAFAALWAILGGGEGWAIGVPVVVIATAATSFAHSWHNWSITGLANFIPYFFWNSLRGGIDVATRALHPRLPINPDVMHYRLRLDDSLARVLMANTVTLLPGTLSADLQDDVLEVHVLNVTDAVTDMLATLERRIARLFGQHLEAKP